MISKERPYVLFVAEVIYSEISKIKKNNLDFSNVDAIDNLDGLERLVVICCGLDAVKDETRSSLYRAVTRAHLMVVVVNEFLRGGWLEFLGSVRLKDERFDARDALERCRLSAADDAVGADVSAAVERIENAGALLARMQGQGGQLEVLEVLEDEDMQYPPVALCRGPVEAARSQTESTSTASA